MNGAGEAPSGRAGSLAPAGPGAGRYAPSPTGDLHLGNLRTALLSWLLARNTGRAFRLRFEDLDADRVRPGVATRQRDDLESLGLDFDGPVVWQSERVPAYAIALEQLADVTYECFCSRRDIADAASAPHLGPTGHDAGLRHYPGTCRDLSARQRDLRRRSRPPALRVRGDGAVQTVHDLLHGEITQPVDDFVVRRNDGVAAYQLAVVVDDAAMGVDQVVRGDDLLAVAPDQAWLATRLGLPAPTYAHAPLVLNPAGRRLAKRDGPVTLADLRFRGIGPDAVLRRLAVSLQLADPGEPVTLELLADRFDVQRLPQAPWVVDPDHVGPPVGSRV